MRKQTCKHYDQCQAHVVTTIFFLRVKKSVNRESKCPILHVELSKHSGNGSYVRNHWCHRFPHQRKRLTQCKLTITQPKFGQALWGATKLEKRWNVIDAGGLLCVTSLRCLFIRETARKKVERDPDDINSSSTPYNTVDDELEWDNSPDNYRLGKSRVLL